MTGRRMSRQIIDKYFCQIIGALNECEIVLQKSVRLPAVGSNKSKRKWVALDGLYEDGTIYICNRPNQVNMVLTLIHEALHHVYPELPEYDSAGEPCDLLSRQLLCEFSTSQSQALEQYLKPNQGGDRATTKKTKR